MFQILHDHVLTSNIFGVSKAATTHATESATLRTIDRSLMRFEKLLHKAKGKLQKFLNISIPNFS